MMRKRKLKLNVAILMAVSAFLGHNAHSQNQEQNVYEEWKHSQDEYVHFDIGQYFTPDIVRNQLDVNFNLNSRYSHSNYSDKYYFNDNCFYNDYNFTGNIASSFSRYVNTRKRISNFIINLSLNENYASQKRKGIVTYPESDQDDYTSDYDDINIISGNSFGLRWLDKWYFSTLFFLNYDLNGGITYNFAKDKTKQQFGSESGEYTQKQKEFNFNSSPRIGVGYGRIENVEDARQAVYIANALSKRNVLTRNLSEEELFALSQQISTIKNKRFLDSRLHLIYEITTVDSFFVKNNLLNDNGFAYFTTLYDMWQYGALFSRKSGYEISFVVSPSYTYDYFKNIPEYQLDSTHYQHQARLETNLAFNYEKPFKLNWQHSVSAGAFAVFLQGRGDQTKFSSIFSNQAKMLSAFANYSLGYYPNTRTNITGTVGQQVWKQIDNISDDIYYTSNFNISANYYLSPYLRITGSYGLLYNYNNIDYNKTNNFSTTLNIQLIYSFF